jgi:hypothetical protein
MWDASSLLPDALLHHGVPEFEYPRSGLRRNIRWIGAYSGTRSSKLVDEVLEAEKAGKAIIAVTSSSVDFNAEHLTIPALEG